MGYCVRLVVPRYKGLLAPLKSEIVRCWGGFTSFFGRGQWLDKALRATITDEIEIIETSVGDWTTQTRDWWVGQAARLAKELGEQAVFLSVRTETALEVSATGETEEIGSPNTTDDTTLLDALRSCRVCMTGYLDGDWDGNKAGWEAQVAMVVKVLGNAGH